MSFGTRTPESLLPRSDSKNPATTCKGITSNGRSCRRGLGSSPQSSSSPSPPRAGGVLAVLRAEQANGDAAAAFFCWQHKDQAESVAKPDQNRTEILPLPDRTSLDTLVDRVGVLNLADESPIKEKTRRHRKSHGGKTSQSHGLPDNWQTIPGPLMSVPSNLISTPTPHKQPFQKRRPRSNVRASFFCCVRADDDDDEPIPPRKHEHGYTGSQPGYASDVKPQSATTPVRPGPSPLRRKPIPSTPGKSNPSTPNRPTLSSTPASAVSHTQGLLSLIPSHLSPQTTSTLLTELSKTISTADAEGYIYMFWLTPESDDSKPDDDDASDLLEPPRSSRPGTQRHPSDVLQRYASVRRAPQPSQSNQPTKTILLKIGRAENVHRRLSQWAKQCSHNITLIRFYPYAPSTSTATSPSRTASQPTKVPHVHRVERLIHVELAERRVTDQGPCGACGKEHREWFEIEASRDGLKDVDAVIRRWVGWAETQQRGLEER